MLIYLLAVNVILKISPIFPHQPQPLVTTILLCVSVSLTVLFLAIHMCFLKKKTKNKKQKTLNVYSSPLPILLLSHFSRVRLCATP